MEEGWNKVKVRRSHAATCMENNKGGVGEF